MEMLTIEGLCKRFGEKQVLKDLSMCVPEGSVFGFIGKNGAGKTTAMKIALGLLAADSGTVRVKGEAVRYGETKTNRHIGYLPDVPAFYSELTAAEYLRFCGELGGMKSGEIRARSEELLRLVGLSGERHRIGGYSRGMKQRLGIAQALLHRPALLICDEPTSALDVVGRREILDILSAVRNQTTVLFSTHILSDVERICSDIAFLDGGRIVMQGDLQTIKAAYRSEDYAVELASPEACTALLGAFPTMARQGECEARFSARSCEASDVLGFLAAQRLGVIRFERMEPTLESLFMEVTGA